MSGLTIRALMELLGKCNPDAEVDVLVEGGYVRESIHSFFSERFYESRHCTVLTLHTTGSAPYEEAPHTRRLEHDRPND